MTSMTGEELVNLLVMERQLDGRLVFVVEGTEDCRLLDMHLNQGDCRTECAGSKTAVLEAAAELIAERIDWALCMVDADFSKLDGAATAFPSNVVITDQYDLVVDALIASPRVVETIAINHGVRPSHPLRRSSSYSIWEIVSSVSLHAGALRHVVVCGEYDISVRNLTFGGVSAGIVRHRELIGEIAVQRSGGRLDIGLVANRIDLEISQVSPPESLLCSHDIASALSAVVEEHGGRGSRREIEHSLRQAITCETFFSLRVVKELSSWAAGRAMRAFTCEVSAA
ncbi:hypothetical protein ACFX43_00175 [Nocardioides sp. YIM B13467]|uniref:hypothetical protein n=1 Tax=Nocardioides sp. YIM B13467 TaxID=3366294 RepID=UPI00366C0BC9